MQSPRNIVFSLALATLFTAPAFAAGGPVYVGADVGQGNAPSICDGISQLGIACKTTAPAYRVTLGYQFHPNVAGEFTYTSVGSFDASYSGGGISESVSAKGDGVGVAVVPSVALGERVRAFVRLGVASITSHIDASGYVAGSINSSKTNVTAGIGLQFDITPALAMRAQYETLGKVGDTNGLSGTNISSATLGLMFRF